MRLNCRTSPKSTSISQQNFIFAWKVKIYTFVIHHILSFLLITCHKLIISRQRKIDSSNSNDSESSFWLVSVVNDRKSIILQFVAKLFSNKFIHSVDRRHFSFVIVELLKRAKIMNLNFIISLSIISHVLFNCIIFFNFPKRKTNTYQNINATMCSANPILISIENKKTMEKRFHVCETP